MKAVPTQGLVAKSIMPYMGVQFDRVVSFVVRKKTRHFRVFTYQAYNAYGLIGSEFNGIAIADDDARELICDGINCQDTGYFGVSQSQLDEFERIVSLSWKQFRDFVNSQPNLREEIC